MQIVIQLLKQVLLGVIRNQMSAVLEKFEQPVVRQRVRDQQRAAAQSLEDTHVDVVDQAAIEDDFRRGVDRGHFLEVPIPDKRTRKPLPDL